tara:strand:- start:1785 stop:2633 length:849 start_codon:yes stop_codon:yes gene_type:complete
MANLKKEVLIVNSDTAASSAFEAAKFGFVENGSSFSALDSGAIDLSGGEEDVSLFFGSKLVGPISEGDVKKTTVIAYSAGTAQVSKALVALESDNSAYVKIINTTKGTMNLPVMTFEAVGAASAEAAADAIKALMDVEFAKPHSPFFGFSAADVGSDAGINITAPKDSHFRLAMNDAGTITYTTAAVPSFGTEAKVKVSEEEGFVADGVYGLAGSAATIKKPASVVSGNYDLLVIEGTKEYASKAVGNAKAYEDFCLYVWVKDGNSTITPAAIQTEVDKLKA